MQMYVKYVMAKFHSALCDHIHVVMISVIYFIHNIIYIFPCSSSNTSEYIFQYSIQSFSCIQKIEVILWNLFLIQLYLLRFCLHPSYGIHAQLCGWSPLQKCNANDIRAINNELDLPLFHKQCLMFQNLFLIQL